MFQSLLYSLPSPIIIVVKRRHPLLAARFIASGDSAIAAIGLGSMWFGDFLRTTWLVMWFWFSSFLWSHLIAFTLGGSWRDFCTAWWQQSAAEALMQAITALKWRYLLFTVAPNVSCVKRGSIFRTKFYKICIVQMMMASWIFNSSPKMSFPKFECQQKILIFV